MSTRPGIIRIRDTQGGSDFGAFLRARLAEMTPAERDAATYIWRHRNQFVKWPRRKVLLWKGEVRKDNRKHKYPPTLAARLRRANCRAETLSNGPAISAFCFAGGRRPVRKGGRQGWKIHHIYDGKFPARPGA